MSWYVFAIVDRAPGRRAGRGFSAPLSFKRIAGGFVAVERRADVPPIEFGVLEKHNAILSRLAKLVPAILPVRFGTLLESDELDDRLSGRDDELAEAFSYVRDRVQFTWRVGARGTYWAGRAKAAEKRGIAVTSGAEYLRRVAAAARSAPPPAYRSVRATLRPLIAAERYQPATSAAPDALYHLVESRNERPYSTHAVAVQRTNPQLSVTGPWPPFAFAPETL